MIKVAPSLLAADILHIGDEVDSIKASGADWLHFDVMDGNFVPNLSFGPAVLAACAKKDIFCDAHLMIRDPDAYLEEFAQAGADIITVHAETCPHLQRTITHIHEMGCKAGVAINPATSPECLRYVLDVLDMVLVMTVNPGFGGQRCIPACVEKIAHVRAMLDAANSHALLQVDGGICLKNAQTCVQKGANVLVAGTAFFCADDRASFVQNLHSLTK